MAQIDANATKEQLAQMEREFARKRATAAERRRAELARLSDERTFADDNGTIAAAVIANHDYDDSTAPDLPWTVDCSWADSIVIHVLAAARAYRGTGVARDLLVHVIDTARSQNMRSLRLEAAVNNTPAVKLYESCGFIPIIVVKRFWGDGLVDAVAMERPL